MFPALCLALPAWTQAVPTRPPVLEHPVVLEKPPEAFVLVNASLRAADPLRADFVEEKRIHALKRPLKCSGRLVLSAKRGLYRATVEPRVSELVLASTEIAQRDAAGRIERIDVAKQPIVKSFVDAFLVVLSGDTVALGARFHIYFSGSPEQWTLGFVPRQEPLSKLIASIVVEGRQGSVERYVVTEKSGDSTTVTWTNVVSRSPLTADEEKRYFDWAK